MDISGAFDNASWPRVLGQLKEWHCPGDLNGVIADYFKERKIELVVGGGRVAKNLTKGCPQGSIPGPVLWNVLFDSFLREFTGNGEDAYAYADDALILVKGNARVEMEERAARKLVRLMEWGRRVKLEISKEKTVGMTLKWVTENRGPVARRARGQDRERKFVVRSEEMRLVVERQVRYLGVEIGERMKLGAHVQKKVMSEYGKLRRLAKANSGMSAGTMLTIQKGMMEPMLLYGAEVWGREMVRTKVLERKWKSIQRRAMILATGAYSTVSHEAVRVIAGVMPIELKVQEMMAVATDVRNGRDRKESKKERREEAMERWQTQWEGSKKGRETFEYLPNVRRRLEMKWVFGHCDASANGARCLQR